MKLASSKKTLHYFLIIATAVALSFALISNAFAFGSGEKTPEEKAAEQEKNAANEYNRGVKNMDKAKEIAARGDSSYAFNYRATSDAKAKKEYEKAVEKFQKAISYSAEFAEAYNNLGYCYRKLDNLKESLLAYHKALELKPNFPEAHEYLGETYLALDSIDQAKGQLQILQELKSPYADTLMKSIEIYKLAVIKDKLSGNSKGE
jgi:tetratricopeptide (TPR) repeat protein